MTLRQRMAMADEDTDAPQASGDCKRRPPPPGSHMAINGDVKKKPPLHPAISD